MAAQSPDLVLQRLDWTVIRRLDGLLQGDYRTLLRGFGLDLADLREYQFGDDIRHIDWNVTARMQSPYVRQFVEDREVTAWFLLDMSPSVDFGTVNKLKRNLLIDFVAVLSRILTRHGNKVGAILYTDRVAKVIPARSGQLQVLRMINDLQSVPKQKSAPFTELSPLLDSALKTFKRRSLVFIISDFISAPGWDRPLRMLSHRHEVMAVRLYDPREMELPDIGPLVMEDAETGEQLYIDTHDRKFRQRFEDTARRREYEMRVTFSRAGVDVMALSTEGDMAREIVRFATLRKQQKAAPAAVRGEGGRMKSEGSVRSSRS